MNFQCMALMSVLIAGFPTATFATSDRYSLEALALKPAPVRLYRLLTPDALSSRYSWGLYAVGATALVVVITKAVDGTLTFFSPEGWLLLGAMASQKPNLQRLKEERIKAHTLHEKWRAAVVLFGSARIRHPEHPAYLASQELGARLFAMGKVPRTGGGPGLMEAPIKGFNTAREESGASVDPRNTAQGIRIELPFEQNDTGYPATIHRFHHFITRKTALLEHSTRVVSLPGGFGTVDELFMALRRDRVVTLLNAGFWGPIIAELYSAWTAHGIFDQVRRFPHLTNTISDALEFSRTPGPSGHTFRANLKKVRRGNEQLETGLLRLQDLPPAITFVGKPLEGSPELTSAERLAAALLSEGHMVRIASRGPVFDAVYRAGMTTGRLSQVQPVLYVSATQGREPSLTEKEKALNPIVTEADSVHQVLITKGSNGYAFLPGGNGTMMKLMDTAVMMQCHKISPRPIVFFSQPFERFFARMVTTMGNFDPPLISVDDDQDLVQFPSNVNDALDILLTPARSRKPRGPSLPIAAAA